MEIIPVETADLRAKMVEEGLLTYDYLVLVLDFKSSILTGAILKLAELEKLSVIDPLFEDKYETIEKELKETYGIILVSGNVLSSPHMEMLTTGKNTMTFDVDGAFYNELYSQIKSKMVFSLSPSALYYLYLAFFKEAIQNDWSAIDPINSTHRATFENMMPKVSGSMIEILDKVTNPKNEIATLDEEYSAINEIILLYKGK